ncbi:RNA polymerase sigma factor (sigma-70 family) [Chitinophaga skermanii]|uniref:RNA polymerase sigma factor (Sigma-70 family) n=1 Tax=Chitinophaga skermanii TaxID=331697 RepID=A0A327Q9V6_9BACT|nr:sigma-70 family RNA polymerase sigma factor [Chitinophaga skermanii]RAJ00412.1 RNA polymerase sigma factor (sigma-70 family) [Chitinophaga skermanii]
MTLHPDNIWIDRVKNDERASLAQLYSEYYPCIAQHILRNNGNVADAEDIFQETLIIFLQKIRQPNFALTASLQTFLFAIARNLWLKQLRDNKTTQFDPANVNVDIPYEANEEQTFNVLRWMKQITVKCQQILQALFFMNTPMEQLMQKMGWKNKHTAANQKYKCLQQMQKQRQA